MYGDCSRISLISSLLLPVFCFLSEVHLSSVPVRVNQRVRIGLNRPGAAEGGDAVQVAGVAAAVKVQEAGIGLLRPFVPHNDIKDQMTMTSPMTTLIAHRVALRSAAIAHPVDRTFTAIEPAGDPAC